MRNLWSVIFMALPFLLVSLVLLKKDLDRDEHEFWRNQSWSCVDVLVVLATVAVIRVSAIVLLRCGVVAAYFIFFYGNLIFTVVVGFVQYKILSIKYSYSFASIGLMREGFWRNALRGLGVFTLYTIIVFLVSVALDHKSLLFGRAKMFAQLHLSELPSAGIIYYVVGLIAIAPLVEEFIFRGLMYTPLRRKLGVAGGVCATSLIWSLHHTPTESLSGVFLIGIILGYLYHRTRSLIPGAIMHSLMNLTNLLIYGYVTVSGAKL